MTESTGPEILVVEDDPADSELILRALREAHPRPSVRVAKDGKEAMEMLLRRTSKDEGAEGDFPRLVMLDLKLPKLSGIEVLRRVKSDARTRATPVIMFSASRERSDVMECYALGANAYVQKPADFESFRDAVKRLAAFWLGLNEPPPRRVVHEGVKQNAQRSSRRDDHETAEGSPQNLDRR